MITWITFTCMLSNGVRYSSNFKYSPSIDKLIISGDQKVHHLSFYSKTFGYLFSKQKTASHLHLNTVQKAS